MHRIFSMCLDAALAAVVLVPLFLLLDRSYFHNKKRTACYCILAVYLSGMFAVVGLPDIRYIRFAPNYNFVPFRYMFSDFTNSFLNVLLFLPLGFFLPVLWKRFKKLGWTVLFGLCTSVLIEVLQIFTFRATDINDLMTNTFGTLLGWCIGRLLLRFLPAIVPSEKTKDVYAVCGVTFGVMFFLHPFLAELVWQILH